MKRKNSIYILLIFIIGLYIGIFAGYFGQRPQDEGILNQNFCGTNGSHYSYFSEKSFFENAYSNLPKAPEMKGSVKGILVNHHLLAPQLIAETISTIATTSPITVVLISPNHFYSGQGQIISSMFSWKTPYGIIYSDCKVISELEDQGVLNVDEYPFKNEHGISGIVSFIKKSLPNAKILPIIIKDTISTNDVNKFIDSLYSKFGSNTLIIGSFDFSHNVTDEVAKKNDKKSISIISNFDYANLKSVAVDSVPGLETVLRYMEREGALNFHLIANTNSAELTHSLQIKDATSYIVGVFLAND